MRITIISTIVIVLFSYSTSLAQSAFDKMTNDKMEKILLREAENVEGNNGNWQVVYLDRPLYIITDENFNRMRIISPVQEVSNLKSGELKILRELKKYKQIDEQIICIITHFCEFFRWIFTRN